MISDPDRSDTAQPLNGEDGSRVAPDPELTPPTIGATKLETALQNAGAECDANSPGLLPVKTPPLVLPVVDVADLDWIALRDRLDIGGVRSRMAGIVSRMENLPDQTVGAEMLFDPDRTWPGDRAINVTQMDENPLWFIGDLHGDLLALEAALLLIRTHIQHGSAKSRIVFLGRSVRR